MRVRATGVGAAVSLALVGVVLLIVNRTLALEAVYPVERAARFWRVKAWPRLVGCFRGSACAAENARLKREVAALAVLRGDLDRLDAENARLRRALGYAARAPGEWLAAGVLSRAGGAAGSGETIRVDKGSLAGVELGAVAVVPEGLVGRVTTVTPHTAEITLLTDRSVKVACEIETGEGTGPRGIVSGTGGDMLLIGSLATTNGISPRCRVLTSGRGGVFPRGIEVGVILDVHPSAHGLSYEGEVLPQVDYSSLEDVFIRHAQ